MNTFGQHYRLTTFGESHGPAMGGVIDGMPAGLHIDAAAIQSEVDRRRPGSSANVTSRAEADKVEILSGVYEGETLGTPIGFIVRNTDAREADYAAWQDVYRPSHADYTYQAKYGVRDPRGGGRASGRETVARVVGGAFARQALAHLGVSVESRLLSPTDDEIAAAKAESDTLGALVECRVAGLKAGCGDPVFGKLSSRLSGAMMSIPAAKGVEIGDGFALASMKGSEALDLFYIDDNGEVRTRTNHSGGIQGGISNGMPIVVRVAFKPIATMPRPVATIAQDGRSVELSVRGRHDTSVGPRVRPVVEAMACMTVLDCVLGSRLDHF